MNNNESALAPDVRLMDFTRSGGCASKFPAAQLSELLSGLQVSSDPRILAGLGIGDDACVYRLNERMALVTTIDFSPPIVDDPYIFGAIAAANALSDIYAVGGAPLLALNVVGFPFGTLPASALSAMLRGGSDKVVEAGAFVGGGHTIIDDIPKYGLAVVGLVEPGRLVGIDGARPGDVLILTKPLGSGSVSAAVKRRIIDSETLESAIGVMTCLNSVAAEAMVKLNRCTATDVTGFGLIGHACEVAAASGCRIVLDTDNIPLMKGVRQLSEAGCFSSLCHRNKDHYGSRVRMSRPVQQALLELYYDSQTSGGLLIALSEKESAGFLDDLTGYYPWASIVGHVESGSPGELVLV